MPLFAVFFLQPGTPPFFLAVMLAGGLVNAGLPLKVVSAQELAPHAVATASGMLMGFAMGTAGVLYIGIGWLQQVIGFVPAMSLSYLLMIPGAILALYVLAERGAATETSGQAAVAVAVAGGPCRCANACAFTTQEPVLGARSAGSRQQGDAGACSSPAEPALPTHDRSTRPPTTSVPGKEAA